MKESDPYGITGLLRIISWRKLSQLFVLILILGMTFGLWENRMTIYNSLKVGVRVEAGLPLVLDLSPGTTSLLDETSQRQKSLIGGIQVVNVDFKKNIRNTAYFAISDPALKAANIAFLAGKISDIPLFTDIEPNNQRIIDLINGEFVCYDFKNTPADRVFPGAEDSIFTICSISIPPYYGRFSGYLNIYTTRKPTPDDVSLIRQISRDLSLHIYEFDIDKVGKYATDQK